jgi:hypothetical protein
VRYGGEAPAVPAVATFNWILNPKLHAPLVCTPAVQGLRSYVHLSDGNGKCILPSAFLKSQKKYLQPTFQAFWHAFSKHFAGIDMRDAWIAKFHATLGRRFPDVLKAVKDHKMYYRLDLSRDGINYFINPHTDSVAKVRAPCALHVDVLCVGSRWCKPSSRVASCCTSSGDYNPVLPSTRRQPPGTWHGAQLDSAPSGAAERRKGCTPRERALGCPRRATSTTRSVPMDLRRVWIASFDMLVHCMAGGVQIQDGTERRRAWHDVERRGAWRLPTGV